MEKNKTPEIASWQERTEVLLGADNISRLAKAHVLIAGVGGVGSAAAEMLCRAGVGEMTIIDADCVAPSNINRQLPALHSTLGQTKVEVMSNRLRDVSPQLSLHAVKEFLTPELVNNLFERESFSFVVDAIDTIQPKCAMIAHAIRLKIPIISSMGAGAKTDITKIQFANLWSTYHCGLSKAVRRGLTAQGLRGKKLPVVFCAQQADSSAIIQVNERNKKTSAGTVSYMPVTFGCFLAQYVITHI